MVRRLRSVWGIHIPFIFSIKWRASWSYESNVPTIVLQPRRDAFAAAAVLPAVPVADATAAESAEAAPEILEVRPQKWWDASASMRGWWPG